MLETHDKGSILRHRRLDQTKLKFYLRVYYLKMLENWNLSGLFNRMNIKIRVIFWLKFVETCGKVNEW